MEPTLTGGAGTLDRSDVLPLQEPNTITATNHELLSIGTTMGACVGPTAGLSRGPRRHDHTGQRRDGSKTMLASTRHSGTTSARNAGINRTTSASFAMKI